MYEIDASYYSCARCHMHTPSVRLSYLIVVLLVGLPVQRYSIRGVFAFLDWHAGMSNVQSVERWLEYIWLGMHKSSTYRCTASPVLAPDHSLR
jgi:hypothetical protein